MSFDSGLNLTPEQITLNKLRDVLTGVVLKSELLESRRTQDRELAAELHEIAQLAKEAVALIRQVR